MNTLSRRLLAAATATLLGAPLLAVSPAHAADPVVINLIGINDFHGRVDADTLKWASTVEQLRADGGGDANSLMVSAGDNVGASVFASAIQGDEPAIDILNSIGLDATAVGNHEFDQGYDDLVSRIVPRANYKILGANVRKSDKSRALPSSATFEVAGLKVAVIGAVTQETPTLVSPDRVAGLTFGDPSDSINEAVTELDALPEAERPDVMVASFHEGAPDGNATLQEALAANATFRRLVENTSPEVDAIFMGHTHQKYVYDAPIPGTSKTRPIVQTGQYGENVGQIKLTVDPDTDEVTAAAARTVARAGSTTTDASIITQYPQLSEVKEIRDDAVAYAVKEGNVAKGEITDDITRAYNGTAEDRGSESTLGNVVADALLYRVGMTDVGADLGIVNPGGLRVDLKYAGVPDDVINTDGVVTRAELNTVLPFANNLNSVKVNGTVLKKILEQQWQTSLPGQLPPSRAYLQLGLSKNVTYTYDPTRELNDRILAVRINGEPLDPAKTYKVATFSFLAAGGDNFRAFREGASTDTGLVDRDGWETFFADKSPVSPSFARRSVITTGVKSVYRVGGNVSYTLSKLDLTSTGSPVNKTVSSKLFYGDGKTTTIASKPVSAGSATIAFTLPAGAGGAMRVESTVYPSGTKVTVPLDVTGATVSAPAASGTFGNDIDVAVKATGPEAVPTGTVTLKDGDTVVGEGTLVDGAVTIPVDSTDLGAGATTLTISYSGDADYGTSTGTTTVTVAKAGTTAAAVSPDPTPAHEDAPVGVTVTSATGTTPSGTVTVSEKGAALGTANLEGGAATVDADLTGLSLGVHTLTVDYAGDADHEASTSTVDVEVTKGTATLDAEADGTAYGTAAVITVTADPGASGLVYIGNGDDAVGVGFLRDGVAKVTLGRTALKPGTYSLDVYYGGSATFDSAQTTVGLAVSKAASRTSRVSVSPSKVVVRRTKPYVTFSVTASGFTVSDGTFTVATGSFRKTVKVVNGRVKVRLPKFTSTGRKTVKGTYAGGSLANGSKTSFKVTVRSR